MSRAQDLDYQPKPEVIEHPERNPLQGFDLRTHIMDAKTGNTIRIQPYKLRIVGGTRYFERPTGSGNLFFESGAPAGRWLKGEAGWAADTAAEHIEFEVPEMPLTAAEAMSENESLKRELAALRAEKEAMLKPKTQAQPQAPARK